LIRALGVAVLATVLVGCGSTSGSSLEDAAEATAAETSRFEASFHITSAEAKRQEYDVEAEGFFDYPNERGLMMISGEIPFFNADVQMREFRVLGRTGYIRWMVKDKSYWTKEEQDAEGSGDPTELLIPFPGSPTKPTDVLTRVLLASDTNENLGTDEVRGTKTTHYRAKVDLRKLVSQLPAADRPNENVEEVWGGRFVPVEIWIDDESRLRRITIKQSSEGNTEVTSVDLFDYGVEVEVEPPPEDELISQEEFDRLSGSSMELEAGEGEPVSPGNLCATARQTLPKEQADEVCRDLKENG
jgi:hypothetical protein